MKKVKLEDTEIIEDFLYNAEEQFNIKFTDEEAVNLHNFNDLFNKIIDKIELHDTDSCTAQQAFYKLRSSIDKLGLYEGNKLNTSTLLSDIIPSKGRKAAVKKLENELGFDIGVFGLNSFQTDVTAILLILYIISFITFFFYPVIGFSGMVICHLSLYLISKCARKIQFKDMRALTEHIVRHNYLKLRRDQNSVNKQELRIIFNKYFSEFMGYDDIEIVCF